MTHGLSKTLQREATAQPKGIAGPEARKEEQQETKDESHGGDALTVTGREARGHQEEHAKDGIDTAQGPRAGMGSELYRHTTAFPFRMQGAVHDRRPRTQIFSAWDAHQVKALAEEASPERTTGRRSLEDSNNDTSPAQL